MIRKTNKQAGKWISLLLLIPISLILFLGISLLSCKSIIKHENYSKQLANQEMNNSNQENLPDSVMKRIGNDKIIEVIYYKLYGSSDNPRTQSITLKGNTKYNMYYFSANNDKTFHVLIESLYPEEKAVKSEFDFTKSAKVTIAPKKTMDYYLSIINISSEITTATLVLTQKNGNAKRFATVQDNDSTNAENQVFRDVDEMPSFGDGDPNAFRSWVGFNKNYPATTEHPKIQGRVFVQFIVEIDGSITNLKILRGFDPVLDREALRVIKSSPKWNPGKKNGKPVRTLYTYPVNFSLSGY